MSLSWLTGALLVVLCWAAGTLLSVAGRRRAALLFAGDSPGLTQTVRAQLSGTALNRLVPANGGLVASHLQLLRQHGLPATAFTPALLGYGASHLLAHLAAGSVVAVLLLTDLVQLDGRPPVPAPGWWALLGLLVLPVLLVPFVRRGLVAGLRQVGEALRLTAARPRAVAALATYELGTLLMLGVGLYAALRASGSSLSLPMTVCVLVTCNVLAGAVPAPGGAGPVDLALVSLLTTVGVAGSPAIAAAALFRLVTHWLPVPLGLLALVCLRSTASRGPARSWAPI